MFPIILISFDIIKNTSQSINFSVNSIYENRLTKSLILISSNAFIFLPQEKSFEGLI